MSSSLPPPLLLLLLLLFVFLALFPSIPGFQYGRCFQKLGRHSIDNSQPLTEIFRTSPVDCLEQCISHTGNGEEQNEAGHCRSVVYDHLQHSCRLYGHDGREVPAIVHPANGFDLYRRTASSQECAGPVQRLLSLHAKKGILAAPSQTGKEPIFPVLAEGGESPLSDQELTKLLEQLDRKGNREGQADAQKGGQGNSDQTLIGGTLDCAGQGRPTGFLSFPGGQREEEDSEEFLGWNQRQCANFCAENEGPDGERQECAGYSYTPGGGKCRLHRRLAEGELSVQSIGGGVYAEKWCIPAHTFGVCRDSSQFQIHLQQQFNPRCVPLAVFDNIQTLVDCMQKCLDQFGCHTVSFNAPSLRCLLHREYPLAYLVAPADQQGWSLAENGCSDGRKGVGLVDSEDGEMVVDNKAKEGLGGGDGGGGEGAAAFGVATQNNNKECGEGEGRLLSGLLLGQKRRK